MLVRTPDWTNPSVRRLEALRALQEPDWDGLLDGVQSLV